MEAIDFNKVLELANLKAEHVWLGEKLFGCYVDNKIYVRVAVVSIQVDVRIIKALEEKVVYRLMPIS